MSEQGKTGIEDIGQEEAMILWLGASLGVAELANELERLGLSDEDGSLADARRLRPIFLEGVEAARRGEQ